MNLRANPDSKRVLRKGAVAPLFALVLPVLFVLAGFAVNLAYMQLLSSELKIATDASAHAGGRAMSITQMTSGAIAKAQEIAALNLVGGQPISLTTDDGDDDITFGRSLRENGDGRYVFTGYDQDSVDDGTNKANSFAVEAYINMPYIFATIPGMSDTFDVGRRSVATQVDRDIALVLDRSGSMLYYENETALSDALWDLYNTYEEVETGEGTDGYYRYGWWGHSRRWGWYWVGYASFDEANDWGWSWWYYYDPYDYYWVDGEPPETTSERLITEEEYNDATDWLYDRRYSDNVINQLANIDLEMSEYAESWEEMMDSSNSWSTRGPAPDHSRWAFLVDGVDAFLTVLENTDSTEHVCLVTFNNSNTLDLTLQTEYSGIRSAIEDELPYDGTGIGDAMLTAHPEIMEGDIARQFAAKTIVVMTDGENNNGVAPATAATTITDADAITIHAVTFATDNETAKTDMENTATNGNGKHYHADTGAELITKFIQIANNLPTILSE